MNKFKVSQRTVFGIIVIFVGVIMLLNGIDIIDADISFATYWPVILIVLGIAKIINFDESTFFGFVLFLVGVFFQLKNLNVEFIQDIKISAVFWPIIIILFGLSLIFQSKEKSKYVQHEENIPNQTGHES